MIKRLFVLAVFILIYNFINAQVIVVDPPFPVADEAVTVTFNATGTGLEGYTGDVYAHTGVTVNGQQWQHVIGSWGDNSVQPQLTNIGTDLYELQITPTIREFYGVSETDVISQLCFVFRSADGSQQTSPDIFYDVYQSQTLTVRITSPEERPLIAELLDTLHITWIAMLADSSFLYINNEQVFADTGSSFQYELVTTHYGANWIKAVATNETDMIADSFYFYVRRPLTIEERPDGVADGINYINDTTVILSLYAPEKKYVFAIGDFSDWTVTDDIYMKLTPDSSRYWVELTGLEPGRQYIFQYLIDGTIRVGDIYADQVSDPWNDKNISPSIYPDLPAYPEDKTTGIATVFRTGQQPYQWEVEDFDPPAETDLVAYELLVRDFIGTHDYNTLTDTLDYFVKLGINAIELMPVSEFEGNSSWGYNPNYYFAPDKYYGPKDTYKKFIDECHKRGIAVIMDMVLNHAYGTCPLVMMYWDSQNNRPAQNSPWFNSVCPHEPYCWGYDFNHKSKDTQNFVDSVNSYWLTEYKIDGFRFDFTKGFTNNNSGGSYDADRIAILKRMADKIWDVKPDAYVILEHFTDNSEEKVLANYGMMLWGNLNYNYNEATMGYNENGKSDFSWISYKKRGWNDPHVMGYMESHDEERLMFKNVSYGNSSGSYNIKDTATALERQALAANFFFTVPGPKMIWQFGERGYDYSINWPCGTDNCRLDPKPPSWNYLEDWRRRTLMYTWSSLIELKKDQDVFKTGNFDLFTNYATKRIRLSSSDMSVVILGNFDVVEGRIDPNFYFTGTWYDYWTGDSLVVSDVNEQILLAPGEYRLYTSKKLQTPDFVGIAENIAEGAVSDLIVYPNPATDEIHLALHLKNDAAISILIYDLQGKVVKELYNSKISGGLKELTFNISGLYQGLYFVAVKSEGQREVRKLMVQ